jgi:UDP-N-acetylglucosamine diphosphorylase/glucosamine-1-phosphate N-acetyltransferase
MDRAIDTLEAPDARLWVRSDLVDVVASRHGRPVNQALVPGELLVNGRWFPEGTPETAPLPGVGMVGDHIAFIRCDARLAEQLSAGVMFDEHRLAEVLDGVERVAAKGRMACYPWDLIHFNGDQLLLDWCSKEAGQAGDVHPGAHLVKPEHIHVGSDASVGPGAVLDATNGPIFIDAGAAVGPNAVVEGPTYVGPRAVVNAGSWMRGAVSLGPVCKVGGEISVSIMHALSNKQHDGFIGHCYVAEWVNLGAGTTTSNLKNTYGEIKVPICGQPVASGQTFVGSIIGDFAKTGINQSLTTGSVVGFSTSLATTKIPPQFVPSFRFFTDNRNEPYDASRGLDVALKSMSRRQVEMSPAEREYFMRLPELSANAEAV